MTTDHGVRMEEVLEAIERYKREYRRPDLPPLKVSGLYALFPEKSSGLSFERRWPDAWPYCEDAGVYFIFGREMNLLYVGKASCKRSISMRLSYYFVYDKTTKACHVVDEGWAECPMYVAAYAVPKGMSFEAPALEEFLIGELHPYLNTIGVERT